MLHVVAAWLMLQQVSLLSHRFRTVLMTLGAVNQVSTEIQVTCR
jgi:hypothetical protein